MKRSTLLATAGTTAVAVLAAVAGLASAGALAAGSSPAVTIRVEGVKKTLLEPTSVKTGSGWITKYGAPKGKCPEDSVQGALDAATHGNWVGKWYSSYNEYFITSIEGEKPAGSNYWEIFLNGKPASQGACNLTLHRDDQLLFADTSGHVGASVLKAPGGARAGTSFAVRLLGFSTSGTSKSLAHIRISGNGISAVMTNSKGVAHITDQHSGSLTLRASPKGYIRSEAIVKVKS